MKKTEGARGGTSASTTQGKTLKGKVGSKKVECVDPKNQDFRLQVGHNVFWGDSIGRGAKRPRGGRNGSTMTVFVPRKTFTI